MTLDSGLLLPCWGVEERSDEAPSASRPNPEVRGQTETAPVHGAGIDYGFWRISRALQHCDRGRWVDCCAGRGCTSSHLTDLAQGASEGLRCQGLASNKRGAKPAMRNSAS